LVIVLGREDLVPGAVALIVSPLWAEKHAAGSGCGKGREIESRRCRE